ncbi:hypothetical protein [Curtobacterium luteum]|uniref:hypothetical protein n=1 Tax=Curtobacterium luteum TaxID=33881 RepID=UPI00380B60FA
MEHEPDGRVVIVFMTEVSIAEYASKYGLSLQGVRRAAREGSVTARKVGPGG